MRRGVKTGLGIILVIAAMSAPGAENLLDGKDWTRLGSWGGLPNKPEGTGEVRLEGRVLTMTRKKLGGDFKLFTSIPAIAPGHSYRFLCKLLKAGPGAAEIKVMCFRQDRWGALISHTFAKGGEWQDVDFAFDVPADMEKLLLQFFPPAEVGGSVSLDQMTLLPAADQRPAAELLQPVVIEKILKPVGVPADKPAVPLYRDENLLLNGDFERQNLGLDTPLYWKHGYHLDEPGSNQLHCVMRNGVFEFQAPVSISQTVDISQEAAAEYRLSFHALVGNGKLLCNAGYRSLTDQKDYALASHTMPSADGWRAAELRFAVQPENKAGCLRIVFALSGAGALAQLDDVVLTPALPAAAGAATNVYLDGPEQMYPVQGICVPADHTIYELTAAKYLRKYLYLAAGAWLDIFPVARPPDNARGLILVGDGFVDPALAAELQTGGYAVANRGGTLVIGGRAGEDGAVHGAFAVLRSLGMEFYTAADYSLPPAGPLVAPAAGQVRNPALGYHFAPGGNRTPFDALGYSMSMLWANPRRTGRWMWREHTAPFLVDPTLYFQEHPEYFALVNSERAWPKRGRIDVHLCLSNPEVQRIAADAMRQWMAAEPWARMFYVFGGDAHGWCECENCRAWDGAADGRAAEGELSDRNLRFVNIIAEKVAQQYPDKIIVTLAYLGSRKAPRLVQPAANVWVAYCPYPPAWNCWRHFDCPKNLRGAAELAAWLQACPGRVMIYDYPDMGDTYPYFGQQPQGGLYAMVSKIRFYANYGARGIAFNGQGAFKDLFNYVVGKVIWNPYTDVEACIDNFMQFTYGKQLAPVMREYFNLVHEQELARALHRYDQGLTMVDGEIMRKGETLLDRAMELVRTENPTAAADIARQKMKLLAAYLAFHNKSTGLAGEQLEQYARRLAGLLELFKQFNINSGGYRLSVKDMLLRDAQIDIGDCTPWHASPVVAEFLQDPVAMLTRQVACYETTPDGLRFNLKMLPGGQDLANYQNGGRPQTVRPFAKVLRRASSPYAVLNLPFELDAIPRGGLRLRIEGLDDEKPNRASLEVRINGQPVFRGPPPFREDDWSILPVPVPEHLLKTGENKAVILNTTPDQTPAVTFDAAEAPVQDYYWGWVMIAEVALLHAEAGNPPGR